MISVASPEKKNLSTVLNKMMATASFTIPSPKSKLNRVGYSSYVTIEIAAITSVEHNKEDINRISAFERTKSCHKLIERIRG